MARLTLTFLVILPGIAGIVVFGFYALIDMAKLDEAYQQFAASAQQSADLNTLFILATQQNNHRINVFAEGVWVLLCAVMVAIGLHGLFTLPHARRRS
ncbi:hypothetical protein PN498_15125 [Oscillatoria sp. CS-180]|uniref:hypothetical protein n=1 Tax=Oscillatoria sp. CS-180 TaxID=3021720 RepID=UPI00232FC664|nr:hypothetical protein [Oscillatoria sp. CS-180]MDB9527331.1 hypothetical protein [Oscillatoria sp. CS-180]